MSRRKGRAIGHAPSLPPLCLPSRGSAPQLSSGRACGAAHEDCKHLARYQNTFSVCWFPTSSFGCCYLRTLASACQICMLTLDGREMPSRRR